MKNKTIAPLKYLFALIVGITTLTLTGCQEQIDEHYLRPSGDSYVFDGDGAESYVIKVNTTSAWTHTIEGTWVIEKSKDDKSITVGAKPNELTAERTGKITIVAGNQTQVISLRQLAGGSGAARYRAIDEFTPVAMSPSGNYIAGVKSDIGADDSFNYTIVVIETATGNRTLYPTTDASITIRAITNDGLVFCHHEITTRVYLPDGTFYIPTCPSGYKDPMIEGVSDDGRVLVGYAQASNSYNYVALRWNDGTGKTPAEVLETPAKNSWNEPLQNGVMARGCSADGSVVYGTEWDHMAPVYWNAAGKVKTAAEDIFRVERGIIVEWGEEYEVDVFSSSSLQASINNISPNGRYLAFSFVDATIVDKTIVEKTHPVLFDIETGKSTLVKDCVDGSGLTALNDGTLSYGTPSKGVIDGFSFNPTTGVSTPNRDWIKTKYNIIVAQNMPIEKFSVDQSVALCWRPRVSMFGVSYLYSYIFTPKK